MASITPVSTRRYVGLRPGLSAFLPAILCALLYCFVSPASGTLVPLSTDLKLSRKGTVHVLCPLPDGSLLVGGNFSSINGVPCQNLAKIAADGTVVNFAPSVNGPVHALGYDTDYIYVGGDFTTAGSENVSNLFRTSRSYSGVDYGWRPSVDGIVYAIGVDDGVHQGSLYVGGAFTVIDGSSTRHLARFVRGFGTPLLDERWLPSPPNGEVRCILPGEDGVYVGGDFTTIGGVPRSRGAHVSDHGTVGYWDPRANGRISALCKTNNGLAVGGNFTQIAGRSTAFLAILDAWGGFVASAPTQATAPINAVLALGNHLYAGGADTLSQTCFRFRASAPYTADTTYRPNLNGAVLALAPSGPGVAVGGSFTLADAVFHSGLARLDATHGTTLNATHDGALNQPSVSAFASLPDGSVIAGGHFDFAGRVPVKNLAKFNAAGVPDPTWKPQPNSQVTSLAVSGDQLYIGGYFSHVGDRARSRLAKLSLSGTGATDTTWNPAANDVPFVLHVADDWLYVGGKFTSLGGLTRNRLGRVALTNTGAVDSTWSMHCNNSVRALKSGGGYLYVGGEFSSVAGTNRQALARINLATGALDPNWRLAGLVSPYAYVSALLIDESWIYVGGGYSFRGAEDLMVYGLCRVATGPSAIRDITWRPGISTGGVATLSIADGYLYAGGYFRSMGAQLGQNTANARGLARIHTTGRGAAEPLWPGVDNGVSTSLISGRRLYVGGIFRSAGAQLRSGSAVINLDSPIVSSTTAVYGASTTAGALSARPSGFHPGVTHLRVGRIGNGRLFRSDEIGELLTGDFVSVAEAAAGFVFQPSPGQFLTGWFELQEATNASAAAVVGSASTAFINLDRAEQTLVFTHPGTRYYADGSCALVATSDSKEPVTFVALSGPVSISGNQATFTGVGEAVIEARQNGSGRYLPAPPVRHTFMIRSPDYMEWIRRSLGTSPSLANPLEDTDNDGLPNLLEFAFSSDPLVADSSPRSPLPTTESVGAESRLVLRFTRRRSAATPELSYVAEFAASLYGPWSEQTVVTITLVDPEWETVTAADPSPLESSRARFARVRVEASAP